MDKILVETSQRTIWTILLLKVSYGWYCLPDIWQMIQYIYVHFIEVDLFVRLKHKFLTRLDFRSFCSTSASKRWNGATIFYVLSLTMFCIHHTPSINGNQSNPLNHQQTQVVHHEHQLAKHSWVEDKNFIAFTLNLKTSKHPIHPFVTKRKYCVNWTTIGYVYLSFRVVKT
jgi:hypothetical protein